MTSTTLSLVAQLLLTSPLRSEPNTRALKLAVPAVPTPHRQADHSRWRLSLQGGQRRSSSGNERFAMIHLASNWTTAANPPSGADKPPLSPSGAPDERSLSLTQSSLRRSAWDPPAQSVRPPASPAAAAPQSPTVWLTAARAAQVVGKALAVYRVAAADQALERMARRARLAAALPDLRLRGGTSADESLRFNPTLDDPARYTQAGARDLWFDAQITWHLRGALFAPEEVAIERLRRQREQDKAELVERVLRALSNWQKSMNALQQPLLLREDRLQLHLSALQAAIRLDALTDNWFSRHAPARDAEATE